VRLRTIVPVVVIAAAATFVATRGLPSALSYYLTPTQVVQGGPTLDGRPIRVGGYVVPGSVRHDGDLVRFVVSDGQTRLPVEERGGTPPLFRGGAGAIVEGTYAASGIFQGQDVMVKHDEVYSPPSPGTQVP
jgi:cytochrome c-type biogenesis protein CcmE